jgi:hypothetical protein
MQKDRYVVVIRKRKRSMRVRWEEKFEIFFSSDVTLNDLSHFVVHMKPNAMADELNLGTVVIP